VLVSAHRHDARGSVHSWLLVMSHCSMSPATLPCSDCGQIFGLTGGEATSAAAHERLPDCACLHMAPSRPDQNICRLAWVTCRQG
jgi:hypothetical protein